MKTLQLRITPFLKSLGFKRIEKRGSDYEIRDEKGNIQFTARVYKTADLQKHIDIFENIYDSYGEKERTEAIVYRLPVESTDEGSYEFMLKDIALRIRPSFLFIEGHNLPYYMGLTEERLG